MGRRTGQRASFVPAPNVPMAKLLDAKNGSTWEKFPYVHRTVCGVFKGAFLKSEKKSFAWQFFLTPLFCPSCKLPGIFDYALIMQTAHKCFSLKVYPFVFHTRSNPSLNVKASMPLWWAGRNLKLEGVRLAGHQAHTQWLTGRRPQGVRRGCGLVCLMSPPTTLRCWCSRFRSQTI